MYARSSASHYLSLDARARRVSTLVTNQINLTQGRKMITHVQIMKVREVIYLTLAYYITLLLTGP
jgi:hypothetical protein